MKTIALVTQKGGTGKSTLAVHLAVAASRQGKVVAVLDLDPQASSRLWGLSSSGTENRHKQGEPIVATRGNVR